MSNMEFEKEIEERIFREWGIDGSVIRRPLRFERRTVPCPLCVPEKVEDGHLQIKLMYSGEQDRSTLVEHEGAHVYVFHLKYPPAHPPSRNGIFDFIAEYYAQKLELERYHKAELREMLGDLGTRRVQLETLGQVGQAIAARLRDFWNINNPILFPQSLFTVAYNCLKMAPDPPQQPDSNVERPFEKEAIAKIRGLLEEAFPKLFSEQINFLSE